MIRTENVGLLSPLVDYGFSKTPIQHAVCQDLMRLTVAWTNMMLVCSCSNIEDVSKVENFTLLILR
jgi:hypothetical protein